MTEYRPTRRPSRGVLFGRTLSVLDLSSARQRPGGVVRMKSCRRLGAASFLRMTSTRHRSGRRYDDVADHERIERWLGLCSSRTLAATSISHDLSVLVAALLQHRGAESTSGCPPLSSEQTDPFWPAHLAASSADVDASRWAVRRTGCAMCLMAEVDAVVIRCPSRGRFPLAVCRPGRSRSSVRDLHVTPNTPNLFLTNRSFERGGLWISLQLTSS